MQNYIPSSVRAKNFAPKKITACKRLEIIYFLTDLCTIANNANTRLVMQIFQDPITNKLACSDFLALTKLKTRSDQGTTILLETIRISSNETHEF